MKTIILLGLIFSSYQMQAQSLSKMPDSVKTKLDEEKNRGAVTPPTTVAKVGESDDLIKARLIKFALNNPELQAADARIRIAEIDYQKSKSTILSSVNLGANINEFVISNSAAASFFPKYNLGVTIPLDIFARAKAAKNAKNSSVCTVPPRGGCCQVRISKLPPDFVYK